MKRTRTRKVKPLSSVKIDSYKVVARAVEEGVTYGLNRSHKYSDNPNDETLKREIETAVMNALSDIIIWPDIYGE